MYFELQQIGSQSEIYQLAKKQGAKWVIVLYDHYHGNSKGCYYSVEDFQSAKSFNWDCSEHPITSVILTDDDVPALIKQRAELIREFYSVQRAGHSYEYVKQRISEINAILPTFRYSSKLYRATL